MSESHAVAWLNKTSDFPSMDSTHQEDVSLEYSYDTIGAVMMVSCIKVVGPWDNR